MGVMEKIKEIEAEMARTQKVGPSLASLIHHRRRRASSLGVTSFCRFALKEGRVRTNGEDQHVST